jgi:hypothetical protein
LRSFHCCENGAESKKAELAGRDQERLFDRNGASPDAIIEWFAPRRLAISTAPEGPILLSFVRAFYIVYRTEINGLSALICALPSRGDGTKSPAPAASLLPPRAP